MRPQFYDFCRAAACWPAATFLTVRPQAQALPAENHGTLVSAPVVCRLNGFATGFDGGNDAARQAQNEGGPAQERAQDLPARKNRARDNPAQQHGRNRRKPRGVQVSIVRC